MNDEMIDLIIDVLMDESARVDEKDDAAMELANYFSKKALKALIKVGSNPEEDDIVLNSCGESIAAIWAQLDILSLKDYHTLSKHAKNGVKFVLNSKKPEWINLLQDN